MITRLKRVVAKSGEEFRSVSGYFCFRKNGLTCCLFFSACEFADGYRGLSLVTGGEDGKKDEFHGIADVGTVAIETGVGKAVATVQDGKLFIRTPKGFTLQPM